jgi:hypothetical protein
LAWRESAASAGACLLRRSSLAAVFLDPSPRAGISSHGAGGFMPAGTNPAIVGGVIWPL